jgi:putative ubiquitin-RnfH superfamily antitoxin RatB of RatAB toxin-antitoxin module
MQKKLFYGLSFAFLSAIILGCGNNQSENEDISSQAFPRISSQEKATENSEQVSDEEPAPPEMAEADRKGTILANNAAIPTQARAFMRSAELRFRVKNVKNATDRIEGLTRMYGGFISRSEEQSQIAHVSSAPISNDSLLEKTLFTVSNTISLRIPNMYFDTLLHKLEPMTDFLEYRRLSADDVSLSLLTNNLRAKHSRELASHLRNAIDKSGKKLNEINGAEQALTDTQNAADDAEIKNLHLKDKIDFCEIRLTIYQRQEKMERIIADNSKIEKFRPSFFFRLWEALSNGWFGFWDMIVGLSEAWVALLFLFGGGFLLWKRFKK